MKLTVNQYLNARNGKPSLGAVTPFYRSPKELVTVIDVVAGQEYNGSAIWYKVDDGQYYWSGGFLERDFTINKPLAGFTEESQLLILQECVGYFLPYFRNNVMGFTGLGVSPKQKTGQPPGTLSLVVQVLQKSGTPTFKIPPTVPYKGIAIPTDVEPCSIATALSPGLSISRDNTQTYGTVGFYARRQQDQFLVTNYHVLCEDLLSRRPASKTFDPGSQQKKLVVKSPKHSNPGAAVIGFLDKGVLDDYKDVVQVKLDTSVVQKNTNGMFTFSGHVPLREINLHTTVEFMGSSSHYDGQVSIHGFHHWQPVNYFGLFTHQLGGLIKLSKCSKPGDSGSPVIFNQRLVGIVVAEDSRYTYCIPIENIIKPLNLSVL